MFHSLQMKTVTMRGRAGAEDAETRGSDTTGAMMRSASQPGGASLPTSGAHLGHFARGAKGRHCKQNGEPDPTFFAD